MGQPASNADRLGLFGDAVKKVYVSAYCNGNVGDDMFVRTLLRRYPDTKFCIFSDEQGTRAFRDEANLSVVPGWGYYIFRCLRKLRLIGMREANEYYARRTDAVVKIGGSIFIEPEQWNPEIKGAASFACAPHVFYIGANFGPYQSVRFLEQVRERLKKADDCCFRDQYSRGIFSDMPNVRSAPDVLFGYKDYPVKCEGNGIGISLISLDGRKELEKYREQYYQALAGLCDLCCERNIPVALFSFCRAEGDEQAVADIISRMANPDKVACCCYNGNIDVFLAQLNQYRYWVATRFHAMILGWSMGKTVLPVIYSKKQSHVIADVDYAGSVWDLLSGETGSPEQLLRDCLEQRHFVVEHLKRQAEKQFEALDRFIAE